MELKFSQKSDQVLTKVNLDADEIDVLFGLNSDEVNKMQNIITEHPSDSIIDVLLDVHKSIQEGFGLSSELTARDLMLILAGYTLGRASIMNPLPNQIQMMVMLYSK